MAGPAGFERAAVGEFTGGFLLLLPVTLGCAIVLAAAVHRLVERPLRNTVAAGR